jgi:molecular chaperone DnaK (HSP70)
MSKIIGIDLGTTNQWFLSCRAVTGGITTAEGFRLCRQWLPSLKTENVW